MFDGKDSLARWLVIPLILLLVGVASIFIPPTIYIYTNLTESEYLECTQVNHDGTTITFELKNISTQRIAVHDYDRLSVDGETIIGKVQPPFDGILEPDTAVVLSLTVHSIIERPVTVSLTVTNTLGVVLEKLKGEI